MLQGTAGTGKLGGLSKLTWDGAEAAIVSIAGGSWAGAPDWLEGVEQGLVFDEVLEDLSWRPCDEPLPSDWELNQPLDLSGEWKMCKICPRSWICVESVRGLRMRRSLNKTCQVGVFRRCAICHPGSASKSR